MKFSLLIASKNEEKDIHLAIDSSLNQDYENFEVIIIDDSTDKTKEVIAKYNNSKLKIFDGDGEGCCQARNKGLSKCQGDIVVFLTADTRIRKNYISSLSKIYQDNSVDIVMNRSFSFNLESVYSRFIEMQYRLEEKNKKFDPLTTQGYSVRLKPALEVGGIDGGKYPYNFCRDWTLVKKMQENGCKKIVNTDLVVDHKSPDNFEEYWNVRKTRGLMSAYQPYYLFNKSIIYLICKFFIKSLLIIFKNILFIPVLIKIFKMVIISKNSTDCFGFYYAYILQDISFIFGEWQGLCNIIKKDIFKK